MSGVKILAKCEYNDCNIRVFGTKIEPWFVAVDVFKVLGISLKNMSRTLERLDPDEKMVLDLSKNDDTSPFKLKGEASQMVQGSHNTVWIVSEPGLYKIMLNSRSEKAKMFTRWVTHEVLPNIRKHGYYKMPNDERRLRAYNNIAKLLGLSSTSELDSTYSRMSLRDIEATERMMRHEHELKEKREEVLKKYPYTESDLCEFGIDVGLAFTNLSCSEEDLDKYMTSVGGEEFFNDKFVKRCPKIFAVIDMGAYSKYRK